MSKNLVKYILFVFAFNIILVTCSSKVLAADTSKNIEQKLQKQSDDILSKLKDKQPEYGNQFDSIMNAYDENQKNSKGIYHKPNLLGPLLKLSIGARKFAVSIYILNIIGNIILLSTLGAKSLEKRKVYIFSSIAITLILLLFLNIPIFVIYFEYNSFFTMVTSGALNQHFYNTIFFLKDNSFVIFSLLLSYGIVNLAISRNNLPRRLTGRYLIKASFVLLIVMQSISAVINFIL